jgi:thioredoxin 1
VHGPGTLTGMAELRKGVLGRRGSAATGLIDLTAADFDRTVSQRSRVLINFWADWCPYSKTFAPVFEQAMNRYPDVVFARMDIDAAANEQFCAGLEVNSVPTVMGYAGGGLIYRDSGTRTPAELDQIVAVMRRACP